MRLVTPIGMTDGMRSLPTLSCYYYIRVFSTSYFLLEATKWTYVSPVSQICLAINVQEQFSLPCITFAVEYRVIIYTSGSRLSCGYYYNVRLQYCDVRYFGSTRVTFKSKHIAIFLHHISTMMTYWINNEVWVGVGEIDPEG